MLIGSVPSKVSNLELQFHLHQIPLWLVYIVWFIGLIWWYKPSHTYLWYLELKHFCNVCMLISTTAPKNIWSLSNNPKIMEIVLCKVRFEAMGITKIRTYSRQSGGRTHSSNAYGQGCYTTLRKNWYLAGIIGKRWHMEHSISFSKMHCMMTFLVVNAPPTTLRISSEVFTITEKKLLAHVFFVS